MKSDIKDIKGQLQRMESSFNERLDAIMAILNRMQSLKDRTSPNGMTGEVLISVDESAKRHHP